MTDYIKVLALGFPDVECYSPDPTDYNAIVRVSGPELPSKSELDNYVSSNSILSTSKVSSEKHTLFFGIKTAGAKNFWLNTLFSDGSVLGYYIPQNCLLKRVCVSFKETVDVPVSLKFKITGYGTDLAIIDIDSNVKNFVNEDLNIVIPAGIQLSCYLESTKIVKDNAVIIDLYPLLNI